MAKSLLGINNGKVGYLNLSVKYLPERSAF